MANVKIDQTRAACAASADIRAEPVCDPNTCKCSKILQPVCATNGFTYDNVCIFDCLREKCPGNC